MHETIRYLGVTVDLLVQPIGNCWCWSYQAGGGARQHSQDRHAGDLPFAACELARDDGLRDAKRQIAKMESTRLRPRRDCSIDRFVR